MGSVAYNNLMRPALSDRLSAYSNPGPGPRGFLPALIDAAVDGPEDIRGARAVRAVLTARRRRDALFNPALFSEPAWDMLLELYALHLEQRRTSVSGLCEAVSVPGSTGLRWIARLEEEGLAIREADQFDGRRSWIAISDTGVQQMRQYFQTLLLGSLAA